MHHNGQATCRADEWRPGQVAGVGRRRFGFFRFVIGPPGPSLPVSFRLSLFSSGADRRETRLLPFFSVSSLLCSAFCFLFSEVLRAAGSPDVLLPIFLPTKSLGAGGSGTGGSFRLLSSLPLFRCRPTGIFLLRLLAASCRLAARFRDGFFPASLFSVFQYCLILILLAGAQRLVYPQAIPFRVACRVCIVSLRFQFSWWTTL